MSAKKPITPKANKPAAAGKAKDRGGKASQAGKEKEPKARKQAAPRRPPGRPTDYSPKLAARICERLAQGQSVRTICQADDMPSPASIYLWLSKYPAFSEQYAKAKSDGCEALFEEMFEIADRSERDFDVHPETGALIVNGEHIQRARLMVDVRKWALSKLLPKKYGDKVDVNHGSQPDNPLSVLLEQVAGTGMKPKPNPARS